MLKLNCLITNTVAVQHIRSAIEMIVGNKVETSGMATFPSVFNDLRKLGLEIDAESAGSMYNSLYGNYNDESLSSIEEVNEYAGKDFENRLSGIVTDIKGETDLTPQVEELGKLSPEKYAVNAVAQLFQKAMFEAPVKLQSNLRKMQDLVTKAATSFNPKQNNIAVTLTDALNNFFNVDSIAFRTLSGQLNTMKTLHDAVKKEVQNYVDQAANKLTSEEEQIFRDKWDKYTEAFINSTYDLILSKGNQNSLVNEALKQVKIDGVNVVDINGNIKWSALISYDNPDTVAEKVKELFANGFTEKDGNVLKYSNAQAEKIGDYFKRIYEQKLNDAKQRLLQNTRTKNKSAKNIISDFIKSRGYFNLVKDNNGKLLLTQSDWNNAMRYIKNQININVGKNEMDKEIRGMDLIQNKLRTFLNSQKNTDGSPKFTNAQKSLIENELVNTILAKLEPQAGDITDIERLIALDQVNNGGAFNDETQQAVNKIVGVSGLNQNVLNQLQALSKMAHSILSGSVVTGSTNTNPAINRGAYAYTALVEIDRKIKEILRQYKIDNSSQQLVVKYIADLMGGGTVSLLINPNNMLENINTQFATNIGESVHLMFTNPKLFFKTFGTLQGDFWTQWLNYAQGGASNEITNENDLSTDLQSSERLRMSKFIKEFNLSSPIGFMKGLGAAVLKSPQYVISIISRTFMNSFDAATTTSLMRKKMIQTTYKSLVDLGNLPADAIKLMDKTFKIPATIASEIEQESKRIENLMTAGGFQVNKIMLGQIKRDMRLSVYEDVIRGEALNTGHGIKQATEITKALVETSQAQAKMLGGKKQIVEADPLIGLIYMGANAALIPQKLMFDAARNAENEGNLNSAARLQLVGSVYQNFIGKFLGGVAKFMSLAITATPYGFITGGFLKKQKERYVRKHPGADNVFTASPDEIKGYAELHGMMRSVFVRASMGSIVMAAFIAKAILENGDDDDDDDKEAENWLYNLMQTKSGRRFIQKHLPLGISLVAPSLYHSESEKERDKIEAVLEMVQVYTGSDFNTMRNFQQGMKYAKSDEDKKEVYAKLVGGLWTTYNLTQPEQFIKFKDVVESAMDKKEISTVEENQEISKEIYKSIEGVVDAFMVNGAIDALQRAYNPKEKFNRFIKEK